ncbi:hypothetical protein K469DRAFT_5442 [Zopfia rhizophila CBS 207.26]|uniref:Uncharacterized protein n=1 Tax=Zopfia rhizophila CBS 207.26 TaxID=1314779 RepID=A0A6A6EUG5_9PEZI|nr:hypothetical protein K469DRAFT_5442 [Zopfia rhizophila CBS 207.26]
MSTACLHASQGPHCRQGAPSKFRCQKKTIHTSVCRHSPLNPRHWPICTMARFPQSPSLALGFAGSPQALCMNFVPFFTWGSALHALASPPVLPPEPTTPILLPTLRAVEKRAR